MNIEQHKAQSKALWEQRREVYHLRDKANQWAVRCLLAAILGSLGWFLLLLKLWTA